MRKPAGMQPASITRRAHAGEGNRVRETGKMDRLPIANEQGVLHLHISGAQPEAGELKRHVEGMNSKNTDHATEPVFNPSVSGKQHRAMEAAAHGQSSLGIPSRVGKEFVAADKRKHR